MNAFKMTRLMVTLIAVFSCSGPLPKPVIDPQTALLGDYIVVDRRSASDVANMATPDMSVAVPIGQQVTFQAAGLTMENLECIDGTIEPMTRGSIPIESDPNLIDLQLGPIDGLKSVGDQRIAAHYNVTCAGRFFSRVSQVDGRVVVMSWANSAINLILEKPLSADQIKRYQSQLKSMKFYSGEINGVLDKQTLAASRIWFEYRTGGDDSTPIPARPAITMNLLDALGVIDAETSP